MKIQLTLRGGIYGVLKLAQIDTEAAITDFPDELFDVIRSEPLRAFRIDASAKEGSQPGEVHFETDQQLYELLVSDVDRQEEFSIPHSALQSDASIRSLIDAIWSRAKWISS